MLHAAEPFLERNLHPTVIIRGYVRALEDAVKVVDALAFPIDINDRGQMLKIIASCIGTKFTSRFGSLMPARAWPPLRALAAAARPPRRRRRARSQPADKGGAVRGWAREPEASRDTADMAQKSSAGAAALAGSAREQLLAAGDAACCLNPNPTMVARGRRSWRWTRCRRWRSRRRAARARSTPRSTPRWRSCPAAPSRTARCSPVRPPVARGVARSAARAPRGRAGAAGAAPPGDALALRMISPY